MARPGPKPKSSAQLKREGARPFRVRQAKAREAADAGVVVAVIAPPDEDWADWASACDFFCTSPTKGTAEFPLCGRNVVDGLCPRQMVAT